MTSVSIVILNWNGRHFLEQFLPSLCKNTKDQDAEIIVADNGSADDSLIFLSENYPDIKLIKFDKNYGFALGYFKALEMINSKYYVLLNSDVEVTPGWLSPLYNTMEANPDAGACMPKILSYNNKNLFEYAGASGGFIDRLGYPFCRGRILNNIETDNGQYDKSQKIFWASGACMFVRREAYEKAGGLDGEFFAHMEEIDLCWRMHRTGYSVLSVPDSIVYHVGGGTLPNNTPKKLYYNYRNSLFMLMKNLTFSQLIPVIFIRMVLDGMSAIIYLLKGSYEFFFAVIRAHLAFQRRIPLIISLRRKLKGTIRTEKFNEIYNGSIIFDFFIRKKRRFDQLDF